ncbi:TolC family protein [Thalassospira sp.]|uniref:TolC family protein n=1 Tax=Thalassospira sp. TaxID=1912094 RepID=UPI0027350E6E|nr:TolC family protein [Thalassospira sp.]MDP2699737.1 TolC family protein [Thalassospira sp.]
MTNVQKTGGRWRAVTAALAGVMVLSACAVTPERLTQQENDDRVSLDLERLFAHQEVINGPLSLEEAIARALKYNLDHRLKLAEEAVSMGQLDVANVNLLPNVVAQTGWSTRNNADTTYNEAKTSTSTSSDRTVRDSDLSVSWNVLDFAIGYMRANQQADLALIVAERRRQVIHNVVNDTRSAYWRAAAAERALVQFEPVLDRVREALTRAETQVSERIGAPLDALSYQEDLLLTLRELETRRRQLVEARTELAVLMNIHPDSDFSVQAAVDTDRPVPELAMDGETLELEALRNRSELRSEAYQLRINQRDSKIAILQMVPGLNFSAGINHTTDSYKVNSKWYDGSLNLSWNLMQIMRAPANMKLADSQIELSEVRRLALSMAVISQVNIARLRFAHAQSDYELTGQIADVQDQIFDRVSASNAANTVGDAQAIRAEVRALLSNLQRDMAYADLQASYGRLFATIGADPLPGDVADDTISSLSAAIGDVLARWDHGEYDAPVLADASTPEQVVSQNVTP